MDEHDQPLRERKTEDDTDADDWGTENEYVANKIVGHSVKTGRITYHVRWYEYFLGDNSDEP